MSREQKSSTIPATITNIKKSLKQARTCSYSGYECSLNCLDNYAYCLKHILEDPNAPYRQCGFLYNSNGRKCPNPAPKMEKKDFIYCAEHARKAQMIRIKSAAKHSLPQTPQVLLLDLKHYAKLGNSDNEPDSFKTADPFVDLDALKVNASQSDILEYASSSDSDVEPQGVTETIKGSYLDDSDNDSLHNAQEDPLNINFLRHAGIFTAEEAIYISREKLFRLQTLYIDQFRRLQYLLKEKRRKYLHDQKKEKETFCSIHDQPRETSKEKKMYEKLKALNKYHRRSGVEAILYRKSLERRALVTDGPIHKPPSVPKCVYTEGGVKCGERTLPAAKHCRKHILNDQNQVLFKACGAMHADFKCHEPVPVIFNSNCVFHMNLPSLCKVEPMIFEEESKIADEERNLLFQHQNSEINAMGGSLEIDPEDDMAGLMREMNDVTKQPSINESIISETSTDTAFSCSAAMSDRDDLLSM